MIRFEKNKIVAGVALCALGPTLASPADLPVPCAAGTCGAGNPQVFVTSGQATYATSGNVGTIQQISDRAILNWQQFNVADGAKVVFNQPRDISVALNRIYDQSPSKILGAVTANGQIYLVNPNGMIFGQNARVNTNTLLASSLDIPDSVFNGSGLAGAINEGGGVAALSAASGPRGEIDVTRGAVLQTNDGGQIFVFAPKIVNEGEIHTPGGQTILAASKDKVYLQFSTDPTLRGFLVEVGAGGEATNLGEIIAERGNITMAGLLVNQQGVLSATTSVRENGSIRLLARDRATTEPVAGGNRVFARETGTLDVGAGSETSVLPDHASDLAAVDAEAQQPSSIELMGREVHIDAGANVVATGGEISVIATQVPDTPLAATTPQNGSVLTIAADARIDVSGDTSTVVPMSRNQLTLDLRSNELADSPLQRGGVLQAAVVNVDVRQGTPVANVQSAIANIPRKVGERLSAGGSVLLGSEGSMSIADGSVIDIAGGTVAYQSGFIATSKLVSDDGKVVDISKADPNAKYSAVFSGTTVGHPDWGVTEQFVDPTGLANAQFEEGYVEGKDAGALTISSPSLSFGGTLLAGTTIDRYQRAPTESLAASALAIDRAYDQLPQRGVVAFNLKPDPRVTVDVTLGDAPAGANDVLIRPEWITGSGLGTFDLATFGRFEYAADTKLQMAGGSTFDVTAGAVSMDGSFASPSGDFELTSVGRGAGGAPIAVGAEASVNVAGRWVNDTPSQSELELAPEWIDGGSIVLFAGGDFVMQPGAALDVSGGARLTGKGQLIDGSGGSISLGSRGGQDTRFVPAGDVRGYALHHGGTLRLEANGIELFGPGPIPPLDGLDFFAKADITVPSAFLEIGGFENYQFVSNRYGTVVAPDAVLHPLQRNFVLPTTSTLPKSGYLGDFATIELLPVELRRPTNLLLGFVRDIGASGSSSVVVMPGARIETDIGGKIDLESEGSLWERGDLVAPAGTIRLGIKAPSLATFPYVKDQVLWVADGASLVAHGAFKPAFDSLGRELGDVLPGGTITLDAAQGFVVTEAGSTFDVGGTAHRVDLTRTSPNTFEPEWVSSDAGAISITAAEGGLIDGDFQALNDRPESVADVRGGTFTVEFDPNRRRVPQGEDVNHTPDSFPDGERNLIVADAVAAPTFAFGDNVPTNLLGREVVSIGRLSGAGFDTLGLVARELFPIAGTIRGANARLRFETSIEEQFSRALTLDAPSIESAPGLAVALGAPLVQVAYDFVGTGTTQPLSTGDSTLTISAGTLDLLGHVEINDFASATFDVSGDVRMRGVLPSDDARQYLGSLSMSGNLTIDASRIYPTTLTDYRIDVAGADPHRLAIVGGAPSDAPLFSVGGSLSLHAARIDVSGRIYAPQGELALTADTSLALSDGAVLSTALQDDVSLFGRTQAGTDWIYPFSSDRLQLIDALPAKSITLTADSVDVAAGSTIDLSGGGKVLAYEFVPGPGGSKDFLDVANIGTAFAIVPKDHLSAAPFEPLESKGFAYSADAGIVLDTISGLPSGEFAILPARFALLPGAYLVTPMSGTRDMVPGEVRYDVDGAPIVAGRFDVLGTSKIDSRYSGFKIQPGTVANLHTEYLMSDANAFFKGRVGDDGLTSSIPNDGGNLVVSAGASLSLDGGLSALGGGGGRSGRLDVVADRIAIVASPQSQVPSYVNLLATDLNAAQVGSISIGAVRVEQASGVNVDVRADSVLVGEGVSIDRPEIVLAANSDVIVESGARIAARSGGEPTPQTLLLAPAAAALVASSGDVDVVRTGTGGVGRVELDAGSSVQASGSLDINVATTASLGGSLSVTGGRFALEAQRLALGDGAALPGETQVTSATLGSLGASDVALVGRSGLSVDGAVTVAAPTVTVTAPSIDRGSNDASLSLVGDTVRLGSAVGYAASPAPNAPAGGSIAVTASEIDLTRGTISLRGFDGFVGTASHAIVGEQVQLDATGSVALTTPLLTTVDGGSLSIDAAVSLQVAQPAAAIAAAGETPGVGGSVALSGAQVSVATDVIARSGVIDVVARSGDLDVADGATLDASGVSVQFADRAIASNGGRVSLGALAGSVTVSENATLNVAGGGAAAVGGTLEASAPAGNASILGALLGAGGSFALDANTVGDFAALNARLERAGFDDTRSYRLRNGDLVFALGSTLSANRIDVTADAGTVQFDGTMTLLGQRASAHLSGGAGVEIGGTIASPQRGDLTINALAPGGFVSLAPAASVDLGGGTLRVRMRDSASILDRLALANANANGDTVLDLVTFLDVGDGAFDAVDQANLQSAFAARSATLGGLRPALPAGTILTLSAIASAPGNLAISDPFDFANWRDAVGEWQYGDRPGSFAFRAGGNLNIAADVSDGFVQGVLEFEGEEFPVQRFLAGPSVGLEFVAGADASSATPYATREGVGNVVIAADTRVRTGSGDVTVRAGGSLVFSSDTSSLYTAGESTGTGGFSDLYSFGRLHNAQYPTNGGAIDIAVGGDVVGAKTRQFISQYMARFGGTFFDTVAPTMYGVVFDNFGAEPFSQNLGSFGGGAVRINAGGDIRDLSVIVPETIQHVGGVEDDFGSGEIEFTANTFVRRGETSLDVAARGDIVGGLYDLGAGEAHIYSEGKIARPSSGPGIVLASSDASFVVGARTDVWVESMVNPTMLPQGASLQATEESSYYFTYTDRARLDASSVGGRLTFGNDVNAIKNSVEYPTELRADRVLDVYPSTVDGVAFTGSIQLLHGMTLYPGAGGIGLFAKDDVLGPSAAAGTLYVSDTDPALLPNAAQPEADLRGVEIRLPRSGVGDKSLVHAAAPVHIGDTTPSEIVAVDGAINAPLLDVNSAEAIRISSRGDLEIGRVTAQNVNANDVTTVESGGDIRIRSPRNPETGQIISNNRVIRVGGGGEVQVVAGRSIDLGSAVGIQTSGNLDNPALAGHGANITVLTGALGNPQFPAFLDQYVVNSSTYDKELFAFVEAQTGVKPADHDEAIAMFAALAEPTQNSFGLQVFFTEIRASGISAAEQIAQKATKADVDAAYARGQTAISTLFPDGEGQSYAGDIKMFFSQIATLEGGNIRLVVPGGLVNAGLATSSISSKTPAELGIVAQSVGDIDVYAKGDVLVNQSRVFTLAGGNIDIWSSQGNIDAGRGAKTALATPGLSAVLGENDSILKIVPPSISGSGIAAAEGPEGELPDIVLSTPNGIIDAGDAGIRTPGKFYVAGELQNVNNISVGSFIGAPVGPISLSADVASVGSTAESASQDIAKSAVESSSEAKNAGESMSQAALSWLDVFLEGYGEPCDSANDPNCRTKTD